jgi:hypothetical protein
MDLGASWRDSGREMPMDGATMDCLCLGYGLIHDAFGMFASRVLRPLVNAHSLAIFRGAQ